MINSTNGGKKDTKQRLRANYTFYELYPSSDQRQSKEGCDALTCRVELYILMGEASTNRNECR